MRKMVLFSLSSNFPLRSLEHLPPKQTITLVSMAMPLLSMEETSRLDFLILYPMPMSMDYQSEELFFDRQNVYGFDY